RDADARWRRRGVGVRRLRRRRGLNGLRGRRERHKKSQQQRRNAVLCHGAPSASQNPVTPASRSDVRSLAISSAKSERQNPISAYLRSSRLSGASRTNFCAISAAFDHLAEDRNSSSLARSPESGGSSAVASSFFRYSASSARDDRRTRRMASRLSVRITLIVTSVARSGSSRLRR